MARILTRKEMEIEIRNALGKASKDYFITHLENIGLKVEKLFNDEIGKLEDLNDSEKKLLRNLAVCISYKATILGEKDIEIMSYIADRITDEGDINFDKIINDALDNYDSAVASDVWKRRLEKTDSK